MQNPPEPSNTPGDQPGWNRRHFLGGIIGATAAASALASVKAIAAKAPPKATETIPPPEPAPVITRKIKVGLVGCGTRGSWIIKLFKDHGGFDVVALGDYFQDAVDKCGDALAVDSSKRFTTLSAYKKVIESGAEAVAFITPPYFFPEHVVAGVDAGLHVYMAKPIAVDAPGCLKIAAAAKKATEHQRCFLVDFQLPTDPSNIEVRKRLLGPGTGALAHVTSFGMGGGGGDIMPQQKTAEYFMRHGAWMHSIAMGGDMIVNFDIHGIDGALWVIGERPVAASGTSRVLVDHAPSVQDAHTVCSVIYEYTSGVIHTHIGQGLTNQAVPLPASLCAQVYGRTGSGAVSYGGKAEYRCADDAFVGPVTDLYGAGVKRNIATFYRNIVDNDFSNPTVPRAVDSTLTAILGRDAAESRARMTMDELIKIGKLREIDLTGLKT